MKTKECMECKQILPVDQFGSNGVVSKKNPTPRPKPRCSPCNFKYEQRVFHGKLLSILGTNILSCCVCGYNACQNAIEFHHRDPSNKERAISQMKNFSLEKLELEISKCSILCANCHREVHAGLIKV